jgi:hypothetical protein
MPLGLTVALIIDESPLILVAGLVVTVGEGGSAPIVRLPVLKIKVPPEMLTLPKKEISVSNVIMPLYPELMINEERMKFKSQLQPFDELSKMTSSPF